MVDFILFTFVLAVFCAGFFCGSKFGTAKTMFASAALRVRAVIKSW